MNAANPGMNFHKLDKARDKNFWPIRVSLDIRLIAPGRIAVKVINHLGDEVMKVFKVA